MEVTSPEVASDAGTLLRLEHLTDEHLPAVRRVAASALTQFEPRPDIAEALQAYLDLGSEITDPGWSPAKQRRMIQLLERVVAPIAPPKP